MEVLSVSQSAYEYIKKKIIMGEYKPGEKLEETRIANELNISRPPLREAFRTLEYDRLITTIPRKGNFVSRISVEDLFDLYQARRIIECGAIDILKEKNIRSIHGIEETLEEVPEYIDPTAIPEEQQFSIISKVNAFHTTIVEAAGNHRLKRFYESITLGVCRYTFLYRSEIRSSHKEHNQLYTLITHGAYEEAKALNEAHIESYLQEPFVDVIRREIERLESR
jgi:DNA-binding GntR family transcriptional regulator